LKANQANLGIVMAMVMAMVMVVRKNVRQDALTIGLAMGFVMIRALTLLVTMMMVTAQPDPQLICQQHLLQRGSRQGNQRCNPIHICKEVHLPDQQKKTEQVTHFYSPI
jgi:predicted tellurium resistance membrane protein TerC